MTKTLSLPLLFVLTDIVICQQGRALSIQIQSALNLVKGQPIEHPMYVSLAMLLNKLQSLGFVDFYDFELMLRSKVSQDEALVVCELESDDEFVVSYEFEFGEGKVLWVIVGHFPKSLQIRRSSPSFLLASDLFNDWIASYILEHGLGLPPFLLEPIQLVI